MYRFTGSGNYLILKIKKTDMSTWKLLTVLAKAGGLQERDIGYAGLKDKSGKAAFVRDMQQSAPLFEQKKIAPTGLLCGAHALRAKNDAYHLEEPFDDTELSSLKGDRRFAWIWPKEVETQYRQDTKSLKVSFTLPKGSYATSFLEEIGKFSLKEKMEKR